MEKLCASKTFLKITGGGMHTSHPTPLVISYRNHQKSLTYFSHLAPLILFFFIKRQNQKGGSMVQCPPKYAPPVKSKKGLPVVVPNIAKLHDIMYWF